MQKSRTLLDRTTCSASLYRLHYPAVCIVRCYICFLKRHLPAMGRRSFAILFSRTHPDFFIRMEVYPALFCIHCNWSNCSFICFWTSVTTDCYVGQNNSFLRLYSSSSSLSSSSSSITSQALIALFRSRLRVSFKGLPSHHVHSVYNSALFLASFCCSFLLHVVASLICIFLVSR